MFHIVMNLWILLHNQSWFYHELSKNLSNNKTDNHSHLQSQLGIIWNQPTNMCLCFFLDLLFFGGESGLYVDFPKQWTDKGYNGDNAF